MLRDLEHPRQDPRWSTAAWVGAAFVVGAIVAAAALSRAGVGRDGIVLGLRLTGRFAFLLFWPSYVAGALVVLFGPTFTPIKRRARDFGLAFAAVFAVHFTLICALCAIGHAPSAWIFIFFSPGVAFILLLALASIEAVGHALGAAGWWFLRNIGMNYLAFDFALDFVRPQSLAAATFHSAYLGFAALAVVGPALRLLAWLKIRAARLWPG